MNEWKKLLKAVEEKKLEEQRAAVDLVNQKFKVARELLDDLLKRGGAPAVASQAIKDLQVSQDSAVDDAEYAVHVKYTDILIILDGLGCSPTCQAAAEDKPVAKRERRVGAPKIGLKASTKKVNGARRPSPNLKGRVGRKPTQLTEAQSSVVSRELRLGPRTIKGLLAACNINDGAHQRALVRWMLAGVENGTYGSAKKAGAITYWLKQRQMEIPASQAEAG